MMKEKILEILKKEMSEYEANRLMKNCLEEHSTIQLEQLKQENTQLKRRLTNTTSENQKLNQELLGQALPLIDREIQKAIQSFERITIQRIEDLQQNLSQMKELVDTVEVTIQQNLDISEKKLMKMFKETEGELSEQFNIEIQDFLQKLALDSDVDLFVKRKLRKALNSYKNDKLDVLIKGLYANLTRKYNIKISKEIVREVCEMSVIQQQTLKECSKTIAGKEKRYIEELEHSVKPLMIEGGA